MTAETVNILVIGLAAVGVIISFGLRYIQVREDIRDRQIDREIRVRAQMSEPNFDEFYSLDNEARTKDIVQTILDELRSQRRELERLRKRDAQSQTALRSEGVVARDSAHVDMGADTSQDGSSLIREITHSLGTPLSQIDSAVSGLSDSPNISREERQSLLRSRSSVRLCNAYLEIFKRAVLHDELTYEFESASHGSLNRAVREACASLPHALVQVELPDKIDNYSNSFLLCVLLPLIDNAAEAAASSDNSDVTVDSDSTPDRVTLRVSNYVPEWPSDQIYQPGYSTKVGHQGVGLVVVRRLLAAVQTAAVDHRMVSDRVVFEVDLPRDPM